MAPTLSPRAALRACIADGAVALRDLQTAPGDRNDPASPAGVAWQRYTDATIRRVNLARAVRSAK